MFYCFIWRKCVFELFWRDGSWVFFGPMSVPEVPEVLTSFLVAVFFFFFYIFKGFFFSWVSVDVCVALISGSCWGELKAMVLFCWISCRWPWDQDAERVYMTASLGGDLRQARCRENKTAPWAAEKDCGAYRDVPVLLSVKHGPGDHQKVS